MYKKQFQLPWIYSAVKPPPSFLGSGYPRRTLDNGVWSMASSQKSSHVKPGKKRHIEPNNKKKLNKITWQFKERSLTYVCNLPSTPHYYNANHQYSIKVLGLSIRCIYLFLANPLLVTLCQGKISFQTMRILYSNALLTLHPFIHSLNDASRTGFLRP
jgi:hypothetical protein